MPSWGILIIVLIGALTLISAFSSSSEIVYATVNKIKVEKASTTNKKAKAAQDLILNYPKLIATILVLNNLVNIALSSAATVLATEIWPENGELIATVFSTLLLLIFGEIIPKTISTRFSYSLCLFYARILKFLIMIFKPVVFLATKFTNLFSPLWTPKEKEELVTDEELVSMVEEIEEEGFIDEDTGELVRSAIDFTDVTAHEIMTHRVDVFAFDIEDDLNELISDVNIFKYSRVPVYKGSIDHVIGILKTKNLIKDLLLEKEIKIENMLTEPIYVHKSKAISEILREFKKTKTHIAIVVDEFGGTMGLVTLEDILEELVGDIWDEMDVVEEDVILEGEDEIIVDGDMNIYDLFDLVDYDSREFESEYTTVGGWCTDQLEKFPEVNDQFTYANLFVTILEVDGMRVEKVKVEILDEEDEED